MGGVAASATAHRPTLYKQIATAKYQKNPSLRSVNSGGQSLTHSNVLKSGRRDGHEVQDKGNLIAVIEVNKVFFLEKSPLPPHLVPEIVL